MTPEEGVSEQQVVAGGWTQSTQASTDMLLHREGAENALWVHRFSIKLETGLPDDLERHLPVSGWQLTARCGATGFGEAVQSGNRVSAVDPVPV